MKNRYLGYKIVSGIIKLAGDIWFGAKVIGKENIPLKEGCILAGNHTSGYDAYMFYCSTKRPIHFLGKKELFDGKFGWFFKMMHVIPVDRKNKNPESRKLAIDLINDNKVIGIFPEGTFHKDTLLLSFKPGAIDFAKKTGAPIIPFAMKSTWKFRCRPVIMFGKPIYIDDIKEEDKVKYLEKVVEKMLVKLNKK